MEISQDIQIAAAPADVAAVMFDPARDQEWMRLVTAAHPKSAGITVGAQVDRTSVVAGRQIPWTTEVAGLKIPQPFICADAMPMLTRYPVVTWNGTAIT